MEDLAGQVRASMDGKACDYGLGGVDGADTKGRGAMDPCGEADDNPGTLAWTATKVWTRWNATHVR
jgi:hypothetical protein